VKPTVMLTLLLCVVSVSVGRGQQTGSLTTVQQSGAMLYDDFNHRWLDPAKWGASPDSGTTDYKEACYYSTNVLECVREIQNGRLRLAVKSYGARDSNEGTQYGESKIIFTQPFVSLTADVVVRSTGSVGCSANTTDSWAQAMFTGRFFNSGSGDPNDDVDAHITFANASLANPGVLDVEGFLFWQGQYFGFSKVGTVQAGTPIRATLRWLPSSHKFIASFENLITHQHFAADVPYSMSDTTPPSGYWDALYVQVFPANCVGQQTSSQMEATFDNVMITR
jgi:hypothetical protein